MIDIKGIIAAPYTPLLDNGEINLDYVETYFNYLKKNGVSGAFINGSTGDFPSLTTEERNAFTSKWCEVADDDFLTMIHVGHTSLKECQNMAEHAGNCGAKVISTLAPYYFKPSSIDLLVDFCAEIAQVNPDLPFLYYHIPDLTGVDFSMVEFLEKGKQRIPNLKGIKFTQNNLMEYKLTLDYNGGKNVLFGVDEIMLSSLPLGGIGWVGSTYNHAIPIYNKIIELFEAGKHSEAAKLQHMIIEFVKITASYGWGGASKYLLNLVGLKCGPVRAPHKNLSDAEKAKLESELKDLGFFEMINSLK